MIERKKWKKKERKNEKEKKSDRKTVRKNKRWKEANAELIKEWDRGSKGCLLSASEREKKESLVWKISFKRKCFLSPAIGKNHHFYVTFWQSLKKKNLVRNRGEGQRELVTRSQKNEREVICKTQWSFCQNWWGTNCQNQWSFCQSQCKYHWQVLLSASQFAGAFL